MQAVEIFPQVGSGSTTGGWGILEDQILPFESGSQSTCWREDKVEIQEAVKTVTRQVSDIDSLEALQQVQDLRDELFHSTAWPQTLFQTDPVILTALLDDDMLFDSFAQSLQPFLDVIWSLLAEIVQKPDSNIFSAFVAGFAAEIGPLTELPEPEDVINGIKEALRTGDFSSARLLSAEGAEFFPDHGELQKYARVLAPPRVVRSDLPADTAIKANREWLKKHTADYQGRWVALRRGELVAVANSFEDLAEQCGDTKDVLLTKV